MTAARAVAAVALAGACVALVGCAGDPGSAPPPTGSSSSPSVPTASATGPTPTTSVPAAASLSPSATAVAPGTLDQNKLAAAITGTLRERLGPEVAIAVSCPAGVALAAGSVSRCGSTVEGQLLVYTVTQTNATGDVDFAPASAVIDIPALENQTAEQYADQVGGAWVADCDTGSREHTFLVRGVGSLIGCTFTGADGSTTAYTVTVTGLDGTVSWLAD